MDQINNFFHTIAISSDHQSAGEFVPECDQHPVKFKFCTFSISSVLTQLQTLDIKKATGPDGISAYFLRSVAEELAAPDIYFQYIYSEWLLTKSLETV